MAGNIILALYVAALFLYAWGFGYFRRYLALRNTPTSKVAALSPGLCEVFGEVESDNPFILFDGTKCIAYRYVTGGRGGYKEMAIAPFYVRDETGRVLVDPSQVANDSSCWQPPPISTYRIAEKDPLFPEVKKFFESRNAWGAERTYFNMSVIPVGSRVHVIGDYSKGKLSLPKLRQDGEMLGFLKFYSGRMDPTKILYQKELPSEELPHIGMGKSKVFNLAAFTEKRAVDSLRSLVFLAFILAPLYIAFFSPLFAEAVLDLLKIVPNEQFDSYIFIVPLYILLMIYPVYVYLSNIYNSLAVLRNNSEKYLSNIDVYLDRRAELFPKLKAVVQGYAKHEKKLMEKLAGRNLTDSEFIAIAEATPKLKADDQYRELAKTISETETQVASFRTLYNDSVTLYNTRLETFPQALFAGFFGFKKMELLEF